MKTYSFCFLILILFWGKLLSGGDLSSQIYISLWTDRVEYIEGEPIYLYITLRNDSETSFMFELHDEKNIIIRDHNQKHYESRSISHFIYKENILSNTVYNSLRDITSTYGVFAPNTLFSYFPAGVYTAQIHVLDEQKNIDITSQQITFRVNEPEGPQKQIFNEFVELQKLGYKRDKKQEYREALNNFIKKFSYDTVYIPLAYYYLQLSYKYTDEAKNKEYFALCERIIQEYPDHPYIRRIFDGTLRYFRLNNDRQGAEVYLKKVYNETTDAELKNHIVEHLLPKVQTKSFKDW